MNGKAIIVSLAFLAASLGQRPSATHAACCVAVWGDEDARLADVRAKLSGTGLLDRVDVVNLVRSGVPTLAAALQYDAIFVYAGYEKVLWTQALSNAAGNVLADYADAGGGVVTATFILGSESGRWILGGRFNSERYHVMIPVRDQLRGHQTLAEVFDPEHQLLRGVEAFDGGEASYRVPVTALAPGSVLVASWSDGTPLVAAKALPDMGRRVDLNFYPPSSDVRWDFWQAGTDGDLLMVNALRWATTVEIPEAGSGLLLLAGLASCVLGVRKRRSGKLAGGRPGRGA